MIAPRAGFTLIEVLVALLVATVLAAAIAASTRAALRREIAAGRSEAAARLVAERLEAILAAAPEELAARDDAVAGVAGGEAFLVRSRIEPGPAPGLWRIAVVARALRDGLEAGLATLRRAAWVRP